MAVYRWRAEFVFPGLQLAREVALDAIHLVPSPRGEHGHSSSTGHLTFETEHHLSDADAAARARSIAERVAVAAAALGGSVGEPELTSVCLDNRDELEARGVHIPFSNGFRVEFDICAPDIDSDMLRKGHKAAIDLTRNEASDRLFRAARWLWKANSDADPYDQFLSLWIAFNILYGGSHRIERQAIVTYLAQAIPTELDAKHFLAGADPEALKTLAQSTLSVRRDGVDVPVGHELQAALALPEAKQSRRDVVRLVCLVIYDVRCDVVHAGGTSIPKDSLVVLWKSRDVLKELLMYLLRGRLGLNVDGDAPAPRPPGV